MTTGGIKLTDVRVTPRQVLEASHAKRSGGDTVNKDILSDQPANHFVQDSAEVTASTAEKETVNAEAAKWVDRVVQEGDSAVQGKLNTLYRYFSCSSFLDVGFVNGKLLRWNKNIFCDGKVLMDS